MLTSTFIILDRITRGSERKIFDQGIHTWDDFLQASAIKGISAQRKSFYDKQLRRAQEAYAKKDWAYFASLLSSTDMWRLYLELRDECCYLDIEAQGKNIIILGLFADCEYLPLLQGKTLKKETFLQIIEPFSILVTFNGSSFDLPLIERYFGITLEQKPHFDVCHAAKRIGLFGGLKEIEKQLSLRRESTISGVQVPGLFKHFTATCNEDSLQQILRYNEEDCKHLEHLCNHVCKKLHEQTFPFTQKK